MNERWWKALQAVEKANASHYRLLPGPPDPQGLGNPPTVRMERETLLRFRLQYHTLLEAMAALCGKPARELTEGDVMFFLARFHDDIADLRAKGASKLGALDSPELDDD